MQFTDELDVWLSWVIKIRFVLVSFVFSIDYAIRVLRQDPVDLISIRSLGMAVILWYVLGLFFLIYHQLSRDYLLQAYLQIFSDIAMVTAIIHITGDLESNYLSLYLVAIIIGSILLPRAKAFMVAAVSFVMMGALLELAYLPSLDANLAARFPALQFLATSSPVQPDIGTLQVKIFASLLGFFAVAYLSSYLAEGLRKTGAELRRKSGQVASLQAMNENIIQSMHSGLMSTDLEGTITALNPAGATILGYDPADLKGKRMEAIFGDVRSGGQAARGAAVPQIRQEFVYHHPRGEPRTLGITESPLMVPEKGVLGYVYNFQDLTDDKVREAEYRAKDRMASLGRLAAGIAHEIRNPLASIAGSVKLLEDIADLNEDQAKLTKIVSCESERLNKLVTDFLLYSREQRFEFRDLDLVNLLEETLLLVEHHPSFGPAFRVERKVPRRPVFAAVDGDKIRQVFWNICDNALKAMPEGGTLTAEIEEGNDGRVRVGFSDTGIGFTSGQLEKLFEPFQPGFSDGTGLGLAIVYQIIEGHRGWIHVDSTRGKGSRFLIVLPCAQPDAFPDQPHPAGSAAAAR